MPGYPQPLAQAFVVCREITELPGGEETLICPFSRVTAPEFPAAIPLSVYAHLTDAHGIYQISLQLIDGEEEIVWSTDNLCVVEEHDPLMPYRVILRKLRVTFPGPGRYHLAILTNGESLARHALWARQG
jgi:hypothetical protein